MYFNIIFLLMLLMMTASPCYSRTNENISLGEFLFYDTSNSQISKAIIRSIAIDDSGKVWVGSLGGGLIVFDGNTWKVFTMDNSGLPSNTINAIAFDHKNTLWIGTNGGLVKYDGTTWTVFTPQNSIMKMFYVSTIAVDPNDNIWFGNGNSENGGLMLLCGNEWKLFTPENSILPCRIIKDILIDSNNTVWVAIWPFLGNGGLARIDGDSWKIYDNSNSIMPHYSMDELCLDNEGNIWAGQFAGFWESDTLEGALMTITPDGNTWTLNNPSQTGKATKRITAIACDKRGYMWVATSVDLNIDYAVSIYNKKQWLSFAFGKDDTSRPYFVPSIAVDKNNNIWFATDDGLAMLKQDTSAIDAFFSQSGTKHEFKQHIRQQKRKIVRFDLLGRKSLRSVNIAKKFNGMFIESDNVRTKKVLIVK
jgi:ligand-binding sensor domain-containing protein